MASCTASTTPLLATCQITPDNSPLRPTTATPPTIQRFKITLPDPQCTRRTNARQIAAVESVIDRLQGLQIGERQAHGSNVRRAIFGRCSGEQTPVQPEYHRTVWDLLRPGRWPTVSLQRLHDALALPLTPTLFDRAMAVINICHLVMPQTRAGQVTGFHFCPPGHQLEGQLTESLGSKTRVFCARYQGKFSTFFPHTIPTEGALVETIRTARLIGQKGDHQLRYNRAHNLAITLFTDAGCMVNSAFPNFRCEPWKEQGSYTLTASLKLGAATVSGRVKDAVLRFAANPGDGSNPIVFTGRGTFFVDLAPQLCHDQLTRVPKGILFRVPERTLRVLCPHVDIASLATRA